MNRPLPTCVLLLVFCSLFLTTSAHSEEIPPTSVPSIAQAPSPSAPTQVIAPYQDTSPPYNYSYYSSGGSALRSDPLYPINNLNTSIPVAPIYSSTHFRRISFPAVPPVLGDPLPTRRVGFIRRNDIEAQLAPYANELFYAPLSGLFNEEDLSRKRRRKLEVFRALQSQLVAELRSHIEAVRDAPNDLRREDFARLAALQAPRLAALEVQAETLRADFVHGGFFSTSVTWNDTRDWRLGDDLTFESLQDEVRVIRAAAYFQEGLSQGQRQLLRELAIELSETIGQPTAGLELDQPKPFIFFSPATARIRLPYQLPSEVVEKIETYTAEKAALKRELREVIYAKDNAWLNLFRTRALRDLAQKQALRIAELDMKAEEIREYLARLPAAVQRNDAELPGELSERIQHYMARKQSVENAYLAKLGETRALLTRDRLEFDRSEGVTAIAYTPRRSAGKKSTAQAAAARDDLAAFNHKHTEIMRELEKEKEAIQHDVVTVLRQKHQLLERIPIDLVLREYGKIFEWQATRVRYSDYQTAVLEPGLSPAQRRLLYGAALETLRLPPTQ